MPCLPPKILHDYGLRFLLGQNNRLCKIVRGVNKVHYGLYENGE